MKLFLAQIESAMKAIDHAAAQSSQWIIVALMVALGAFGWFVIRYLVKREDIRSQHESNLMEARITALVENTALLREVKQLMHDVRELLRHQK